MTINDIGKANPLRWLPLLGAWPVLAYCGLQLIGGWSLRWLPVEPSKPLMGALWLAALALHLLATAHEHFNRLMLLAIGLSVAIIGLGLILDHPSAGLLRDMGGDFGGPAPMAAGFALLFISGILTLVPMIARHRSFGIVAHDLTLAITATGVLSEVGYQLDLELFANFWRAGGSAAPGVGIALIGLGIGYWAYGKNAQWTFGLSDEAKITRLAATCLVIAAGATGLACFVQMERLGERAMTVRLQDAALYRANLLKRLVSERMQRVESLLATPQIGGRLIMAAKMSETGLAQDLDQTVAWLPLFDIQSLQLEDPQGSTLWHFGAFLTDGSAPSIEVIGFKNPVRLSWSGDSVSLQIRTRLIDADGAVGSLVVQMALDDLVPWFSGSSGERIWLCGSTGQPPRCIPTVTALAGSDLAAAPTVSASQTAAHRLRLAQTLDTLGLTVVVEMDSVRFYAPMAHNMRQAIMLVFGLSVAGSVLVRMRVKPLAAALEQRVTARTAELAEANRRLSDNERRLKTVLAVEPECLWLATASGRILEINPAGLTMLQADSLADLVSRNLLELVAPDYQRQFREMLLGAASGTANGLLEFRCLGLKGGQRWLESHSVAFPDPDDGTPLVLSVTRDITARKLAEEGLRESRTWFANLVNSIGAIVMEFDLPTQRFTFANEQAERILGHPAAFWLTAEGWTFWKNRIHPKDRATVLERHPAVCAAPVDQVVEYRFLTADGHYLWLRDHVSVVPEHPVPTKLRCVLIDVSASKAAEESVARAYYRLAQSEMRFRTMVSNVPGVIFRCGYDAEFALEYASDAIEDLTGYSADEFVGDRLRSFLGIVHPDDIDGVQREVLAALNEQRPYQLEYRILHQSGDVRWVRARGQGVFDEHGEPFCQDGVIFDITDAKVRDAAWRENEQRLRLALSTVQMGAWEWALDSNLVRGDRAFFELFGHPYVETGVAFAELDRLVHPEDIETFWRAVTDAIDTEQPLLHELRVMHPDGKMRWLTIKGGVLKDEQNRVARMIGINYDTTERRHTEERIRHLAYHDNLTDLPNRALFQDRLEQAIYAARRHSTPMAVLFIDLDHFKTINDTLGHATGDELLRVTSHRLQGLLREEDTVARLGGDEFVILLPRISTSRDAGLIADRVLRELGAPLSVSGHTLQVSASVGISLFPKDGEDSETLLMRADAALYQAKETGRSQYQFFDATLDTRTQERLQLGNQLRRAVENNELSLHYQPQVNLVNQQVSGIEALLRWQHPEFGWIPPSRFVPLAEELGLIVDIGAWVLERAIRDLLETRALGLHTGRIAVNLSARQLQSPDLCRVIEGVLADTGLPAADLELEITESSVMTNIDEAVVRLQRLADLGVFLALDDFGTGYSSLAYLKRLPVHRIKIDRSFVRDLPHDPDDAAIVRAIAAMASALQRELIAEGVENRAQMEFLLALPCPEIQGFGISRPLPIAALRRWLEQPTANELGFGGDAPPHLRIAQR